LVVALVNHTTFGTVSSTLIIVCIFIPPLRLPLLGLRPELSKTSTCLQWAKNKQGIRSPAGTTLY
ncbi:MAG: hypothetical protein LBD53_11040, partial [Tannerella sp.]|nr:hypothetical protein [Tannerella sp.]